MGKNPVPQRGANFIELLALLFIGLKLTDYIDWSWLWVLSPLWIGLGLALIIGILFGIFGRDSRF